MDRPTIEDLAEKVDCSLEMLRMSLALFLMNAAAVKMCKTVTGKTNGQRLALEQLDEMGKTIERAYGEIRALRERFTELATEGEMGC